MEANGAKVFIEAPWGKTTGNNVLIVLAKVVIVAKRKAGSTFVKDDKSPRKPLSLWNRAAIQGSVPRKTGHRTWQAFRPWESRARK